MKPVFEAALTYEPDTGVIEVVANTLEDRKDLTSFMARDLLGVDFEGKHIPMREYDLSMLLKPFDFPTDDEDGIKSVTVKELRFMEGVNAVNASRSNPCRVRNGRSGRWRRSTSALISVARGK